MISAYTFFVCCICLVGGAILGMLLTHIFIESVYDELLDETLSEAENRCLQTIRENYYKEQSTRKILLQELGEALDIDVIELPSFGYVILKGAVDVSDQIA